ncbi:hypothetical protein DL769_000877 [Monosporascus sp. CRB-8-3]|nr:hypothetical protein DL769_000877 [Monosporascus sp. CRB-8-3]
MATPGQLPAELLRAIGDYLTIQEVAALRQVSRDVSAKISRDASLAAALHSKTRSLEFSVRSLELFAAMTPPRGGGGRAGRSCWSGAADDRPPRGIREEKPLAERPGRPAVRARRPDARGRERAVPRPPHVGHGQPERARRVPGLALAWPRRQPAGRHGPRGRLTKRLDRGGPDVPPDARGDAAQRPAAARGPRPPHAARLLRPGRRRLPRRVAAGPAPALDARRRGAQLHVSLSGDAVNGSALPGPPAEETGEILEEAAAPPHAQQAEGLARFLAAFRSVDDFKLHWDNTSTGDIKFICAGEIGLLQRLRTSGNDALAGLTRCSLQGLMCNSVALLDFLRASPGLQELEMYHVSIERSPPRGAGAGAEEQPPPPSFPSSSSSSADFRQMFRSIFDWLTRPDTRLLYLWLEDPRDETPALLVFRHEPTTLSNGASSG